jgi:hypothetical protein
MKKIITVCVVIIAFSACFKNYFKVNTDPKWSVDKLKSYGQTPNRLIVHFNDDVKEMTTVKVENNNITGNLKTLYYGEPGMFITPDRAGTTPYKSRDKEKMLTQLHVYVNDTIGSRQSYTITQDRFLSMETYSPDAGATVLSYVGGGLLILAGLLAVSAIITLIACNCPQVYVETGPAHFEFISGMYSGAVMKTLERTDMLPLTGFTPLSDTIRVRITGMPGETQYLNHASLKQVAHPAGTEVVGTRHGDLFVVSHLETPKKVIAGNIIDRSKSVSFRDGNVYGFHVSDSASDNSELILHYNRKSKNGKALLVARVKNTYWGGYVYKQFKGLYGNQYATWVNQQEKDPNSGMMTWQKQQGVVMKVSVFTKRGWEYVDYFPAAGNTAARDFAMEMDLKDVEGDEVMIKLESAYRFWEVDQAALSFDPVEETEIENIPQLSSKVRGSDAEGSLASKDDSYISLAPEDQLNIEFKKDPQTQKPGIKHTYVLVLGGYYHQKAENNNAPQVKQILKFQKPGQFHRYSMEKYNELGLVP